MKKELREVIREIVEELLDEAMSRDAYIERLYDTSKGAMGEYFKARYAELNAAQRREGVKGTSEGWDREAETLLITGFFTAATKKMKGGDARKAFAEALTTLRLLVPRYLAWARKQVSKDFGIPEQDMVDPSDDATDEFFARLDNLFDEAQSLR